MAGMLQGCNTWSPFPRDELQIPTAGGAPASSPSSSRNPDIRTALSELQGKKSGHSRVNGPHSRVREKEAGRSQTGGEGSEGPLLTTQPALLGEIHHPQQWPQLFSSALKETDLGSRYQRGPSCRGFCLACKTVRAAAFMCRVMDDGKEGRPAADGHSDLQVKTGGRSSAGGVC